jgi:fatty acid desaturase
MASSNSGDSTEQRPVDGRATAGDGSTPEDRAEEALRVTAFWTAVVLPFFALAVFVSGLDSTTDWFLFVAIVVVNLVSLYVGHPYQEG